MAKSLAAATELSPEEHRRQLRRAVIASTVGTTIEWYDFFLYSIVTGLVFAKLYFPQSDPIIGTLQAFGSMRWDSSRGPLARRSSVTTVTASAENRR